MLPAAPPSAAPTPGNGVAAAGALTEGAAPVQAGGTDNRPSEDALPRPAATGAPPPRPPKPETGGMLLTMFGNPSAALAAPAAADAAGFAILIHWFICRPFMEFEPNELIVVSALTGFDMPNSPRIPFDANGEFAPTSAVGVVPRPRKLRRLESPELDDVDAVDDAVDAVELSGVVNEFNKLVTVVSSSEPAALPPALAAEAT
jgi:hypothetical protein